jgi:hypothetical protein
MDPDVVDYRIDGRDSDEIFLSDQDFVRMQMIRRVANIARVNLLDLSVS